MAGACNNMPRCFCPFFLGFFKTVAANSRNQQTANIKNIGLLKAYTKL